MSAAEPDLDSVCRHLRGLPERPMRVAWLADQFESAPLPAAFALFRAAVEGRFPDLHDALRDLLEQPADSAVELSYPLRVELYRLAREAGHGGCMTALRAWSSGDEADDPPSRLHMDVAELPLGTRRSLARSSDPDLLAKLALDPDPVVVEHLLQNPRIRESDVVQMAARRPGSPRALRVIAASARWGTHEMVQRALVCNPATPVSIACHRLASLPPRTLREVAADAALPAVLRAEAARQLERRPGARD